MSHHPHNPAPRLAAFFFLICAALLCAGTPARAEKFDQLSPQGYINDFAGVIDAGTRQQLTALCQELDQKADAQITVVTIHTLEGDSVEDFANRLFQKWGVGPKGKDRGVMILLAVDDHQYWTEVGYGLEPILPDGKVGGFGRDMVPLLRQNQYSGAVLQMTSSVAAVIAQDRNIALGSQPAAFPQQPGSGEQPSIFGIPANVFFFLVVFLFFGGWRLLAFFLGMMGFNRYRRGQGSRGGWWMGPMGGMGGGGWSGSSGGGFGGGGGGFGGFGGGMSGGGGAGGGW